MAAQPNNVQHVRCLKCLKIIECSRYDTSGLVNHVQTDHPEIIENGNEKLKNLKKLAADHGVSDAQLSQISKMTGLTQEEMADEAQRYLDKNPTSKSGSSRGDAGFSGPPNDSRDLTKRQYYRASIERWTPVDGSIYCPQCGCCRRPMIRSSSEFYASTGCCAQCVASCWPFCFLPCLISPENKEYLHCANCQVFLGLYDRENNCIKPNRQFLVGDCSAPPKSNSNLNQAAAPNKKKCKEERWADPEQC